LDEKLKENHPSPNKITLQKPKTYKWDFAADKENFPP